MSISKVLGIGAGGVVAAVLLASDVWVVCDATREHPLSEAVRRFDQNRDNMLDSPECIEAIAELVDDGDGILTQFEIDTKGREVIAKLYIAGGRNNKQSARTFGDEMIKVHKSRSTLSEWQSAVNLVRSKMQ